jgi:hexosaminidase
VQTTWGIFKEVFCPTDETFKFLEDVLDETIDLFKDSPTFTSAATRS